MDDMKSPPNKTQSSRAEEYAVQRVEIVTFIRHILEQYRFGLQILSEFIQNADDARAAVIDIGLDERNFSRDHGELPPGSPIVGRLLGPALTFYNNEVFTEEDFENITSTGESAKRGDAGAAGRFCLGVNTGFHLGDCIILVTGNRMVAFDPSRSFFPDPMLVEFGDVAPQGHVFADMFPDFCLPFAEYGINFRERYEGTLFRIPLRQEALPGGLSKRVCTPASVWEQLLEGFCAQAAPTLIFLRSIKEVRVHSVTPGGKRIDLLRARICEERSREFLSTRGHMFDSLVRNDDGGKVSLEEYRAKLKAAMAEGGGLESLTRVCLVSSVQGGGRRGGKGLSTSESQWLLCTRMAGKPVVQQAMSDPDALLLRKVPIVQVACCLDQDGAVLPDIDGCVHVVLPLVEERGHTMHCNVLADTTPDRRKLLRYEEGTSETAAAWSRGVMSHGVADASCSIISFLARTMHPPREAPPPLAAHVRPRASTLSGLPSTSRRDSSSSDGDSGSEDDDEWAMPDQSPRWYCLFPRVDTSGRKGGDALVEAWHLGMYARAYDSASLWGIGTSPDSGAAAGNGEAVAGLCSGREALTVPSAARDMDGLVDVLEGFVRESGKFKLVRLSQGMMAGFKAAGLPISSLTPSLMVGLLRGGDEEQSTISRYLCGEEGRVSACLRYILADERACKGLGGGEGTMLALTLDGNLKRFRKGDQGSDDESESESESGDDEEEGYDDDDDDDEGRGRGGIWRNRSGRRGGEGREVSTQFYLANDDQKVALGGVRGHLSSRILDVSEGYLNAREVSRLRKHANVTSLQGSAQQFCLCLGFVLPCEWSDKTFVDPTEEWSIKRLEELWRHLSTYGDLRFEHISSLGFPLFPTRCKHITRAAKAPGSSPIKDVKDMGSSFSEAGAKSLFDLAEVTCLLGGGDVETELDVLEACGCAMVDFVGLGLSKGMRKSVKASTSQLIECMQPGRDRDDRDDDGYDEDVMDRGNVTFDLPLLRIVARIHAMHPLTQAQVLRVSTWQMFRIFGSCRLFSVSNTEQGGSSHRGEAHDLFLPPANLPPSLVPLSSESSKSSFIHIPTAREGAGGKWGEGVREQVHNLFAILGVPLVDEALFYADFLLGPLNESPQIPTPILAPSFLSDFLVATLPRLLLRSDDTSAKLMETLKETAFVPCSNFTLEVDDGCADGQVEDSTRTTPADTSNTVLRRPRECKEPSSRMCRLLFASDRFPCPQLAAREEVCHVLRTLGMRSSLSDEDLEHGCLYPSRWSGKDVVFLPGGGEETQGDEDACWSLDKVYAAWTLATPDQRSRCYFAVVSFSEVGVVEGDAVITLLRGDAAGRAFSVDSRAIGCPPPDLLARLGLMVVMSVPEFDFSKYAPTSGAWTHPTPKSLLASLSNMQSLQPEGQGCSLKRWAAIGPSDRDALLGYVSQALHAGSALFATQNPAMAWSPTTEGCGEGHDEEGTNEGEEGSGCRGEGQLVDLSSREREREDLFSMLKLLPLHREVQSGDDRSIVYSAMSPDGQDWTVLAFSTAGLPSDALDMSGRRFLLPPSPSAWVYDQMSHVGKCTSPSQLYGEYILPGPTFASLSQDARAPHLDYIIKNKLAIRGDFADEIATSLKDVPMVRDETGVLRRACDYVDTKNANLRVIFTPINGNPINGAAKGQLVPIPSHSDESVMELLRRLGMRCDVRDSWFFSQCARRLAMLGDAFAKGQELEVSETQIFDAGCFLFDSLTHFQGDTTLLSTISRVPFIPTHRPKGGKLNLACALDLAPPSLGPVQFLVRPCLHETLSNPPKGVEVLLWPHTELDHDSSTVQTLKQLQKLTHMVGVYGAVDQPEHKTKRRVKELEAMVGDVYVSLDQIAKNKDVLLNNLSLIRDEMRKFASIYVPCVRAFVKSEVVFTRVTSTIPGLLYRIEERGEWSSGMKHLLAEVGISERPIRVDYLRLFKRLIDRSNASDASPLTLAAVRSDCHALLREVSTEEELMSDEAFRGSLVAPDEESRLITLDRIFVNDDPMLAERIQAGQFSILHPSIASDSSLVKCIRVPCLSTSIQERVDESKTEANRVEDLSPALSQLPSLFGAPSTPAPVGLSPLSKILITIINHLAPPPASQDSSYSGCCRGEQQCRSDKQTKQGQACRPKRLARTLTKIPTRVLEVTIIESNPYMVLPGRDEIKLEANNNAGYRPQLLLSLDRSTVFVCSDLAKIQPVLYGRLGEVLDMCLEGELGEKGIRLLSGILASKGQEELEATMGHMGLVQAGNRNGSDNVAGTAGGHCRECCNVLGPLPEGDIVAGAGGVVMGGLPYESWEGGGGRVAVSLRSGRGMVRGEGQQWWGGAGMMWVGGLAGGEGGRLVPGCEVRCSSNSLWGGIIRTKDET